MMDKPELNSSQMGHTIQDLAKQGILSARQTELLAGQSVFEADQDAAFLYLIEYGQVRVYHVISPHVTRLMDILGPNAWLGLAVLCGRQTYGERAVAIADSSIWAVSLDGLRDAMVQQPLLAIQIIQSMAYRLNQAWKHADQLVSDDCKHRLIQTLLRFSTSSAATQIEEGTVLRITHAQLAQAIGAARETVSVCLNELRLLHVLRTGRNKLLFKPETLVALLLN